MTAALIYPRISQAGQSAYSLTTQIEAAEQLAAVRGYTVAGVFPDEYSGEELDRPALSALLEAIPRTGATVVLVHDIDRLGREVYIQAITEHQIEQAGARVEFVLEPYEGDSGQLLKAIKGGIAAYENRQRVERSRRGKNGKAQTGYVIIPSSRVPYGYDYHAPTKKQGQLTIRDDQAAAVRTIYDWLTVHQLSSYEIARRLYEAGVPSKGDLSASVRKTAARNAWTPTSIRRLVANTVYKGVWYWGKTRRVKENGRKLERKQPPDLWIAVPVPAIVSVEQWEAAQTTLAGNKTKTYRETPQHYLLRGMVFCSCGRRWFGQHKKSLGRAYYRCPTAACDPWRPACPLRFSIRQDALEGRIWRYVVDELLHPDNLSAELERQRVEAAEQTAKRESRLQAIAAAIRDVDRKLEILLDEALGGMPKAMIEHRKRSLLGERRDLEDSLAREESLAAQVDITPTVVATIQDLARQVQEAEPHFIPEERRQILTLLRLRVDVLDQQTVRVSGLITGAVLDLSCTCRTPCRRGHRPPDMAAVGVARRRRRCR